MSTRRQALGRGLSALLGDRRASVEEQVADESGKTRQIRQIPIEDIYPNPHQPRNRFSQDSLRELADSIRQHGVLQPILVTPKKGSDHEFILLAGERRFRASQLAELSKIPAIVSEATEEEMLEIALVENIQRDDLNPMEEARAYRALMDSFGWSQEEAAKRVGKKRSTVANALRLLKLSVDAARDLEEGRLTAGHARAILSLEDAKLQEKLRQEIVRLGLSVREAERRSAMMQAPPLLKNRKKTISRPQDSLDTVALEERLMAHLGCRVKVRSRDGQAGVLEIPFRDPDELQRFLDAVGYSEE